MSNEKELLIEPWRVSPETRKEIFKIAKKAGKKVALYYDRELDVSTFRYRCFNMMQATEKSKKWQAVFFIRDEIEILEALISDCDLLVLGRQSRWDGTIKRIIELARKYKKLVLLDLDDLVFDKRYLHVVMNTISNLCNLDYWIPYFSDINKTAKRCNGFLVTNDFLGERIQKSFEKPYRVIRNSLNDEQVAASTTYLKMKTWLKKEDREKMGWGTGENGFIIGYFGGTPTHVNDLEVALPELLAFLDDYSNAILRIVGYMDFDERLQKYLETGRIQFRPFVDFRKLQRLMAEVDVNIAPLVINEFTNCKSELKFFEAGAVETTTIASPTYTFKKAIKDGENGFLAYPGEWYEKLEYLYKHPKENQKIANNAREYAMKHYYGKEFLKEVEQAYDYFEK